MKMMPPEEIHIKWQYDRRSGNGNLSTELQIHPQKKEFRNFNGIRTDGLYVSAAVLYHLSYEDPYININTIGHE